MTPTVRRPAARSHAMANAPAPPREAVYLDVPGPDQEMLRVVARVAEIPNLEGRYLFLVGVASRAILAPAANIVGVAFAVFVAFCAFMVAATTALQVRFGLSPLHKLTRDIADVRRGQSERLQGDYPAELQPVHSSARQLPIEQNQVIRRLLVRLPPALPVRARQRLMPQRADHLSEQLADVLLIFDDQHSHAASPPTCKNTNSTRFK